MINILTMCSNAGYYGTNTDPTGTFLMFLFIWIGSAILSSIIVSSKKHSGTIWFILALLFGVLALIAAVGLPVKEEEKDFKQCPQCLEDISPGAKVCPYCGYKFSKTDVENDIIEMFKRWRKRESYPREKAIDLLSRDSKESAEIYAKLLNRSLIPLSLMKTPLKIIVKYEKEKAVPLLLDYFLKNISDVNYILDFLDNETKMKIKEEAERRLDKETEKAERARLKIIISKIKEGRG